MHLMLSCVSLLCVFEHILLQNVSECNSETREIYFSDALFQ